ncbi:protein-L-isoaspartate(D-aspartate) O-methyltransferase [Desulfoluna limicola]
MFAPSSVFPVEEVAPGKVFPSAHMGARLAVQAVQGKSTSTNPAFSERQAEREAMVKEQIEGKYSPIRAPRVLDAMRRVPRHLFVPKSRQKGAYRDTPLPIGHGQTISQPYIVAFMTEALELAPEARVLEIGTGSGYQAAVLAELTPHVYTVEIIEPLAEMAQQRLKSLGYGTISTKQGDGYHGWKEHAPYDAIIVTCAAGHVPPPLIEQLKPGGTIVIPVGGVYQVQMLMKITKKRDHAIVSEQLIPVRFVPMTGRADKR